LELDDGEKRAIEYLQKKENPKLIKALGARFEAVRNHEAIVVHGWLQHEGQTTMDFEVVVDREKAAILSWKMWKRKQGD
jgi:hypothetical protein